MSEWNWNLSSHFRNLPPPAISPFEVPYQRHHGRVQHKLSLMTLIGTLQSLCRLVPTFTPCCDLVPVCLPVLLVCLLVRVVGQIYCIYVAVGSWLSRHRLEATVDLVWIGYRRRRWMLLTDRYSCCHGGSSRTIKPEVRA